VLLGGSLRPAANYASARLAGSAKPVSVVAHSALAGTPVGPRIGIAGAPEGLPGPAALLNGAWALCLGTSGAGGTGGTVTDLAPAGRTEAAPTRPILVTAVAAASKTAMGTAGIAGDYVLWGTEKFPVPNASVLAALGLGDQVPVPADAAWLAVLPTGEPIGPAAVPGAGAHGARIAGQPATVGQLFQATAAGVAQFYVLRTDGLAPITRTEAALFATAPGYRPPVPVGPADIAAAPASSDQSLLRRLPDLLSSTPYTPDGARLCVLQPPTATGAAEPPPIMLVTEADRLLPANASVVVPPGTGLLAATASSVPQTGSPLVFLITDAGERFELQGTDALGALGYTGAVGHVLPDAILSLVPAGPALSVAGARKELPWSAG
jgi:type VII secretion protein EccB